MRKPVAQPAPGAGTPENSAASRAPLAFAPDAVPGLGEGTVPDVADFDAELVVAPTAPQRNWAVRLLFSALGLIVSLSFGLAAEALISDLFDRYEWLGWLGAGAVALFVFAVIIVVGREGLAVRRLASVGRLRDRAAATLVSNLPQEGEAVAAAVSALYAGRADLARAQAELAPVLAQIIDGADRVTAAERALMSPLDRRARALTAAAARRVTLVTAISPRALVDLAFVAWESMRLARAIASLYGVRPGLIGSWRLFGAVISSLAVTGGVALGDSVVQQLLGQGLAARLSARLGEGLVNGLMTVRVGIAAMRVTRPLPFAALKQPMVMDFATDLARVEKGKASS